MGECLVSFKVEVLGLLRECVVVMVLVKVVRVGRFYFYTVYTYGYEF